MEAVDVQAAVEAADVEAVVEADAEKKEEGQ